MLKGKVFLLCITGKNAGFIILNTLRDEGPGLRTVTNKISIFGRDGTDPDIPLQSNKLLLLKL